MGNPIVQFTLYLAVVVLPTLFGRPVIGLDEFLQLASFVEERLMLALEQYRDL